MSTSDQVTIAKYLYVLVPELYPYWICNYVVLYLRVPVFNLVSLPGDLDLKQEPTQVNGAGTGDRPRGHCDPDLL